jgi:oxygen-dependent protoporphyrinogen oxidase
MNNHSPLTTHHAPHRIVVIGGGITGLAAAHRLIELRLEKSLPMEVLLLEASDRWGGNIATRWQDGFLIEEGPDAFISQKPWALTLCQRIGIADKLIQTNETYRRTFVVHRGRLHPVPEGFYMLAPTKFTPFILSPLFSWCGKARMAMDLILPRGPKQDDESLASFVTRRLGREALDRIAQPLVSGVYTSDPQNLSLRTTMPRFLEMEKKHRSIILAMWREQQAARNGSQAAGQKSRSDGGARYSLFVSFKDGMATLIDELVARLPDEVVRLGHHVERILPHPAGSELHAVPHGWQVVLWDGTTLNADGVIITTPAYHAAALVETFDHILASQLSQIQYASSAVVNLAYRRSDVPHPLDGFGFVVPAIEKRSLIACSFSSVKFAGRAPEGYALLRCFLGGGIQPEIYHLDDDALLEAVRHEMRDLLGITAPPLFSCLSRHPKSMPQYAVGHLQHVAHIKAQLETHRGLLLAGNAYGGVGIPDCVRSGEEAAEKLAGQFMDL